MRIMSKCRATVLACVSLQGAVWAADGTWTNQANGAWSNTANWQGGTVASGAGSVAYLSNLAGPVLVTNDVASLKLKGVVAQGGAYTLYGLPLTLEGTASGNYGLIVNSGAHAVGSTVNLNASSQIYVGNGASLTTTGLLDYLGNYTLTKRGEGEWAFAGTCAETNASAYFDVVGGVFRVASGAVLTKRGGSRLNFRVGYGTPGRVVVDPGATLNLAGFVLGYDANANGSILVDGGTLTADMNQDTDAAQLGRTADSRLCLSNNAVANFTRWLNVGCWARGEVNIGSGGALTADRLSLGWLMDPNTTMTGMSAVCVGDGTLRVNYQYAWRTSGPASRTNEVTVGNGQAGSGRLILPATVRLAANPSFARLTLNGGTLELLGLRYTGDNASLTNYLYGLDQFRIGQAGATIDTSSNVVTITQVLERDPSFRADGGLTKLGTGMLTLAGGVTVAGPTVAGQGTLRLQGALPTKAVVVSAGATLSLADGQYRSLAPSVMTAGQNGESVIELEAGAAGVSDSLALPAGAQLENVAFVLVGRNAASSYWLKGDYVIATYAGADPDVSGWHAPTPTGVTATFEVQSVQKRVVMRVTVAATGSSVWLKPGSGAWSDAANWSTAPANDPGTAVLFGAAPGAAASVGIGSAVTVGSMTFDSGYPYTLSGEGITFGAAGAAGTLSVAQGSHTIASAVSLPTNLAVAVQTGAAVLLGGGASGSGRLYVTGGGTLAFTNGAAVDVPLTVDGATLGAVDSTTLDTALTVGEGGAGLSPSYGKTLTVSGSIGGSGALTKSGASIAVLSGANSGTGTRTIQNGTLTLSSLTDGGDLVLGEGTLKYVGPDVTTGKGFTIRTSDPKLGAAFETDADVTFNGNIKTENGVFIKAGKGTVTFAAPGNNQFGTGFGSDNAWAPATRGAYGESPTQGLRVFQILAGKVVVGVPGQTNTMNNQTVIVGGETTAEADAETAGQLEINGGVWKSGFITIGRGNGSAITAPTGLVSTVRVNGGEVSVYGLWMAARLDQPTITARPLFEMNDGALTGVQLLCGNGTGTIRPRLLFNGGFAAFTGSAAGDVRLAYDGGCTSETVIAGGTLAIPNVVVRLADDNATAKGVMRLNGGRLITRGLERLGNGVGELYLNGGVLQPCQNVVLTNLSAATVQAGGLVADVPAGLTLKIDQTLSHDSDLGGTPDGGVIKLGDGTLVLGGAQGYTGPTVILGGVLRVSGSLAVTNLTLSAGAVLSLTNGAFELFAPSAFAAGDANGNAIIELDVAADGSACDVLALPGGFGGAVTLRLFKSGTALRFVSPGRYPLMTFSGSSPNTTGWSLEGLGEAVTFEAEGSVLYVRIGAVTASPSVWTNTSGGAWGEAGNWSVAPANDASASVLFGEAIAAPATIATGSGATFGYLAVDSANAYTWSGGALTLGSSASNAALLVAQGAHVADTDLAAPSAAAVIIGAGASLQVNGAVTGAGSLAVTGGGTLVLTNGPAIGVPVTLDGAMLETTLSTAFDTPFTLGAGGAVFTPAYGNTVTVSSDISGAGGLTKSGSSFLTLSGGTDFGGELVVRNGTVSMATEPEAALGIGEGTFRYTGTGAAFTRGYTVRTTSNTQAATIDTDTDITFNGQVQADMGAFIKLGGGTLTYAYAGENILSVGDNEPTGRLVLNRGLYGDTPTQGYRGYSIFNGSVILGAAGQTNLISRAILIGGQSTTNADAETAGHMAINGGVTIVQDFITVGRGNGSAVTAPTGLVSTLTVNGGETTVKGFWMAAKMNDMTTLTARPLFTMNGGELSTLLFYCGEAGGTPKPRIVINGGTLKVGPNDAMRLATSPGCETELTLSGGTVVLTNQPLSLAENQVGAKGTLNLDGGRLVAQNMTNGLNGAGIVNFNGGVFQPSASQTLSTGALTNRAGGAIFDVPQGVTYTLARTIYHDAELGATPDGGLLKLGEGTLVMSGPQAYTGPTVLSNGTLAVSAPAGSALAAGDLSLGSSEGPEVALNLTADQARFLSGGAVMVYGNLFLGKMAVTLVARETGSAPATNGTYLIATCAGTISGDAVGLRLANGAWGKEYVFAVVGSQLRLTVGTPSANAVLWKQTTGGDWSEAANWVTAPASGEAGMAVGFLDAITAPAEINVSETVTAGTVRFNNVNTYTLSGSGSLVLSATNGPAALTVDRGTQTLAIATSLSVDTVADAAAGSKLSLTAPVAGDGKLTKSGGGRLQLSGNNTYAGGTEVSAGVIDIEGSSPLGTGSVTLRKETGLASQGGTPSTVANGAIAAADGHVYLAAYAPLTLSGEWRTAGNVIYSKTGTNELTIADGMRNGEDGKSRLELREGALRFAAGADVYLRNATADSESRNHIDFGTPQNNPPVRRMTVEDGATVTAGCMYMGFGATNIVAVTGGSLNLQGHDWGTVDAFLSVGKDAGPVANRFEVSGGSVFGGDNAWWSLGAWGQSYSLLALSAGSVSLGMVSLGNRDMTQAIGDYGQTDVLVGGGLLEARQRWNWMGDANGTRLNTVFLNGGRLRLPATYASVENVINQSRLIFNGGTLETPGGGTSAEDPDSYLAGLKQAYVDDGGAVVDTLGRDVTLAQRLMTLDGAEGGVVKRGLGMLTLARPPCVTGRVDVQSGALRLPPDVGGTYPDDALMRLTFENGITNDSSAYKRAITLVGSAGSLTSVDAPHGTNAVRFNAANTLLVNYANDMKNANAFTISVWARQSAYQTVTKRQTIISTIANYGSVAHEYLLRVIPESGSGNFRFLGTGENNYPYGNFTADVVGAVPLNTWVMLTFVADGLNGFKMYVNGTQRTMKVTLTGSGTTYTNVYGVGKTWLMQPPFKTGGRAFNIATVGSGDTEGFVGDLDDVTVYRRALSQTEIAALYQAKVPFGKRVRVAAGAALDLAGAKQEVAEVTGEGFIGNGTAVVTGTLNPGDSAASAAGALLTASENLTLATNMTYTCNWTPDANDLVDVWGTLTVNGAGTIDLGLTEPSQMPGAPRHRSFPVMYYTGVSGAANFSQWNVTGIGRVANASVSAANGVVTVNLEVFSGTVLMLR